MWTLKGCARGSLAALQEQAAAAEASPFFQVVREYFDEFERVYLERYQKGTDTLRPKGMGIGSGAYQRWAWRLKGFSESTIENYGME